MQISGLSIGVGTKIVRLAQAAAALMLVMFWTACGDYYRPVAFPLTPAQPTPAFAHVAVVLTGNGANNAGASTTIDVSGDAAISQAKVGVTPVHAAMNISGTGVFVANHGDDTISLLATSSPVPVTTIGLPPGSAPVFVATSESAAVYVADFGTGTVSVISTVNDVVTNTVPVGGSPVAISEIPNGQKVYVANTSTSAGNGSVVSINSIDKTVNRPIVASAAAPWISPAWVVSRSDSQRVYVLDKGSGFVSAIDTSVDAVVGTPVSVGVGADYMIFDPTLDRIYVTNPVTNQIFSLDASSDSLTAMTAAVANPVSISALLDGTRIYVAGAAVSGTPPNQTVSSKVTVLYASDLSVKTTIPLTSVSAVCATKTYSELSMAAAADSSRVYVGNCDAGNTSIIRTTNDTVLSQIPAPLGQSPALHITAATLSGSNTIYSYTLASGLPLKVGMTISISGMGNAGNNGSFTIAALGVGTFTVSNSSGVTAGNQLGTGVVSSVPPPNQNPVFVLAGP